MIFGRYRAGGLSSAGLVGLFLNSELPAPHRFANAPQLVSASPVDVVDGSVGCGTSDEVPSAKVALDDVRSKRQAMHASFETAQGYVRFVRL
jgi:hypothetical protein